MMNEQMIDALPYIAVVLAITAFALYKYTKHREAKFREKKEARLRKTICEDTVIMSQYADQRLQVNLMALDAARQMADAAAKSPNYGQKSD